MSDIRRCSLPDCNEKHCGLGYCNKHYLRFKKFGDPHQTKFIEFCTVEGCDKKHASHGLCHMHNARVRNTGTIDLIPGPTICKENRCNELIYKSQLCLNHWEKQRPFYAARCSMCYENFYRYGPRLKERQKLGLENHFCSKKCRDDYAAQIGMVPKKTLCWCDNCERPYSKPKSLVVRAKHKFCSLKCMYIFQNNEGWYEACNKGIPLAPELLVKLRAGQKKYIEETGAWNKGKSLEEYHVLKLRKKRNERKYTARNMINTDIERKILSMLAVNDIPFEGGIKEIFDLDKQKWRIKSLQKKFSMPEGRGHRADAFVTPNIIIEADGWHHKYHEDRDQMVDGELKKQGFTVIRFSDSQINKDPQFVFRSIISAIKKFNLKLFKEKNLDMVLK